MELERFDSRRDKSIGRKLLRFDARGVGPLDGGTSELVEREAGFEWSGGKPFKASVDGVRCSESMGKFPNTSADAFLSRTLGATKFLGGESSIGVVGMSTFIEGGPCSAGRLDCDRPKDWACEPEEGNRGSSLGGTSGLILPIDIFFKKPHRLDLSFSSFLRRRSNSSPGEEGGRGLTRDLRWDGVGGLEGVVKVEEVEEEGPAGYSSSKTVSQPVLLSGGRDLFAETRVGLPVTPKLAKRFGGTFISREGDWAIICGDSEIRRFELDREVP